MNKLSWSEASEFFVVTCRRMLILIVISLPLMSLIRFLTHAAYGDLHDFVFSTRETLMAYWIGLRFDLSALSYLALPPLILALAAGLSRSRIWWWQAQKGIARYFFFAMLFLALCLGIDAAYYSYFQDHFNVLMFGLIHDDTTAVLKSLWRNYPIITYLTVYLVLGFLILKGIHRLFLRPSLVEQEAPTSRQGPVFVSLRFVLPCLAVSLSARGSLGLFPLSVQDTVVSSRSFLNHLAYNGFHAFIRACKLKQNENRQWNSNLQYFGYTDPRQAFADYFDLSENEVPEDPLSLLHHKTPRNIPAEKIKPHVLIIMMESFGSAYFRYDRPNFQILGELRKHFSEDILTTQFLPSHSSTIGSLSSFIAGAPQRPDSGFLTESEFLQVPFRTAGAQIFKNAGYRTRFLYGGNPGWRDINKFAKYQGFDSIEGDVDVENFLGPIPEKHDWGIYDEDLFKYIEKTIASSKEPQLLVAMTTTNHPPYTIPKTFKVGPLAAPPELESRLLADRDLVKSRFQAFQYSNQMLGEFLTRIKKSELSKRLIIAVTGDHSFWMVNFSDQELLQKWGVPLYLYIPPELKPKGLPQPIFGSHFDIFPTLYPLALSEAEFDALGRNLLAATSTTDTAAYFSANLAFNPDGGIMAHKGREAYSPYRWTSGGRELYEKIEAGESNPSLHHLAKKYKALMSLTDYYFMKESEIARGKRRPQ